MENSNPVQNTPAVPPPAPTVMQAPPQPTTPGKGKTMWLIGLLVVIILFIGATYFYQSSQQKVTQPTPEASTEVSLESELNSISVEDIEGEFSAVDQDLQNL